LLQNERKNDVNNYWTFVKLSLYYSNIRNKYYWNYWRQRSRPWIWSQTPEKE